MTNVIIYTTKTCPFCIKAKSLFKQKSVEFNEIDVTNNENLRNKMIQEAGGRRTVPQIFINGQHVGGCDDVYALEKEGRLNILLQA